MKRDDLAPVDEEILDLLQSGRITAPYAAEVTGYSKQYLRDRLKRLVEHGIVEKVHQGLYGLKEDPR